MHTLYRDRLTSHHYKKTEQRISEHGLWAMLLPPKSADLNTIENKWGILSRRVYAETITYYNTQSLFAAIKAGWYLFIKIELYELNLLIAWLVALNRWFKEKVNLQTFEYFHNYVTLVHSMDVEYEWSDYIVNMFACNFLTAAIQEVILNCWSVKIKSCHFVCSTQCLKTWCFFGAPPPTNFSPFQFFNFSRPQGRLFFSTVAGYRFAVAAKKPRPPKVNNTLCTVV